jgi:hypothetical protein
MSAEWLQAVDDDDAALKARERGIEGTAEVWDRNRIVVRIEPPK